MTEPTAQSIRHVLQTSPPRNVPAWRLLRREWSRTLNAWPARNVIALSLALLDVEPWGRLTAYELIAYHPAGIGALTATSLRRLGRGLADWASVDTFSCYLAGPAWREGRLPTRVIHQWLRSPDRWQRRAAIVCTVEEKWGQARFEMAKSSLAPFFHFSEALFSRMILRPGLPSDAEAIARLIATFQSELTDDPSGVGAERYLASVSPEAERAYLASERYAYVLAEEASELVGFVAIRDGTHVFHLFVSRAHQRRGIARALWQHAKALVANQATVAAYTVNSSILAVPVYRAFGFVASGPPQQADGITFQPMKHD